MLFKQLALVATTAAFLVVPDLPKADENIFEALPFETGTYGRPSIATAQSVSVLCKQCKGKNTHLEMDFAVEDSSRLTLNGFELYPQADPWHGDLMASVVRNNGKSRDQRLGYSLAVKPEAIDEEQHLEVIGVRLRIIEVGSLFVEGMPTVEVKLIKSQSGEIIIGNVNVEAAVEKDYDNSFLRIKEKFNELWKQIKGGCHHSKAVASHEKGANIAHDGQRPHHGAGRPAHHGHGHKHNAHHRHSWGKLIKNIAANVVLPVLTGITAGVGVAVFGMALCSFFAMVFQARRERSRRASLRIKAPIQDAAIEEEKAGLMGDQEAPPQYEDCESSEA